MEKKTIGKFISALRRAKGLTQRELGDMLYVTDKTVSRWENDECTPDLNLIPAIADIFGVTCDELLRGERRQHGGEQPAGESAPSERGKKQLEAILRRKYSTFRNLTFIPFGLALLGLIVAIICVLCGKEDNVTWLGFLLPAFLAVTAVICEVLFAINGTVKPEEQLEEHARIICVHNVKVMRLTIAAIITNVFIFGLCKPFVLALSEFSSLLNIWNIEQLFLPGTGLGCILALAAYGIYFKVIRPRMVADGTLKFTNDQDAAIAADNKLLLKISLIFGIIYIILVIFSLVVIENPHLFYFESGSTGVDYSYTALAYAYLLMPVDCAIGAIIYFAVRASRNKKRKNTKN